MVVGRNQRQRTFQITGICPEFTENGMVWSSDGKYLAVATGDRRINFLDASGQVAKTMDEPGKVLSLQWSADGKALLSVVVGGIIHARQ